MNGTLTITLERRGDRTVPTRLAAQAPLTVSWTPRRRDPAAHLCLINQAGLTLGGDRFQWRLRLAPRAEAFVTFQSYGKLAKGNGGEACEETEVSLGKGSCLTWMGEPTLAFGGTRISERMVLRLGTASRLFWISGQMLGRLARGERLAFRQWSHRLELYEGTRRSLLETWTLRPPESQEVLKTALDGYGVMGLALVGLPLWSGPLEDCFRALNTRLTAQRMPQRLVGVSTVSPTLKAVRFLASDGEAYRRLAEDLWNVLQR